MQRLVYISIFIFLFCSHVEAQKTVIATMKISATIVSGVTLNHVETINVDLEKGTPAQCNLKFTTPEHLDTDVDVKETVIARNEYGDQLKLTSESEHYIENGRHRVNLKTSVDSEEVENLKGHYQGNLTTTINYL